MRELENRQELLEIFCVSYGNPNSVFQQPILTIYDVLSIVLDNTSPRSTEHFFHSSYFWSDRHSYPSYLYPLLSFQSLSNPSLSLAQLPLEPWTCAALGSSLPRPPSQQPHPRLTPQWPLGHLLLQAGRAPQASSPSARSSPSVAKGGGGS